MDAPATAAQPTEQMDMGALQSASRHPHPGGPNPTSLSQRTLCRHTSKVGTVCVNRASTGLCGGYRATDIPTATESVIGAPSKSSKAPRGLIGQTTLSFSCSPGRAGVHQFSL